MGNELSCPGQICLEATGCPEGEKWDYYSKSGISELIIRHSHVIDTIQFKHKESSESVYSDIFGGNGGGIFRVKLDFPSEFLTGISGSYDKNINSLQIHTNRAQYGPFGSPKGTRFSFVAKDGMITGFHGWAGQHLNAIGVYLAPVPSKVITKTPWGGAGGHNWDDGVFSAVKEVHALLRVDSGVPCGIRFTYERVDGSSFLAPLHGCMGGASTYTRTLVFGEEDEFLIGIEGSYGQVEKWNVIKSLTFMTNKGKYGPFGDENGTYFCSLNSMDCKRKVVGFHGRSGCYLDAIGIHTQYLE